MSNVTNLNMVEYEKKIEAAVAAEIAKGRDPNDFDDAFLLALSESVYDDLSPAARKHSAIQGLNIIAEQVCGGLIAEKLWQAGYGWDASDEQIIECGRQARIADADVTRSLAAFREVHGKLTINDAKAFTVLERFLPLFVMLPPDARLEEAASRKAACGDKLALSFLAWKEVA